MPNHRIAVAATATNDLATLATGQAAAAKARIEEVATALGVPIPVDVGACLVFLAAIARASAADAVAKDAAYGSRATGHLTPATARDQSVKDLYSFVRDLRGAFTRAFGADAANAVFPGGATPRERVRLVTYAEHVATSLSTPGASWTLLPNTPAPLDVSTAAAKLTAVLAAAKGQADVVGAHEADTKEALQARSDAYARLHDQLQGLHHALVAFHEIGGAHELADHVTVHHHASAAKAETPAPPAPPPPKVPVPAT